MTCAIVRSGLTREGRKNATTVKIPTWQIDSLSDTPYIDWHITLSTFTLAWCAKYPWAIAHPSFNSMSGCVSASAPDTAPKGLVYKLYRSCILSCILQVLVDTLVDELYYKGLHLLNSSSTSSVQACKLGFLELYDIVDCSIHYITKEYRYSCLDFTVNTVVCRSCVLPLGYISRSISSWRRAGEYIIVNTILKNRLKNKE